MYPTVNTLMGLWRFVTAERIEVVEHCGTEIEEFLRTITPDAIFEPESWKRLIGFVRVIPDGDILPTRAQYSAGSNDWQVAVNCLYSGSEDPEDGLWFALPDVVASVLLTGKVPRVVDAFRVVPRGTSRRLKRTELRGLLDVDPRRDDFFKRVIEERKRLAARTDLSDIERSRHDKALKVLANATSYGIFAQMDRQETATAQPVTCYGIDPGPFVCKVAHPEAPGEYCFPPLAALITGAARLMLALLERCVTDVGGTYAMEDTDSMAIVATERGGLVRCPGGPHHLEDGCEAVLALSWAQVRQITERFEGLNPYDRSAIPGSILKIEADNFDPDTGKQRQLWCLAISAKRYALFLRGDGGSPVLLRRGVNNAGDRWSEHGLGHLLNPTDPGSGGRDWIGQAWLRMIRGALALPVEPLGFEARPAVGRVTISSPAVIRPLEALNRGKAYPSQLKPFNFLLSCHVKALGHPVGADPEHFHLIAPYELDARRWTKIQWTDQYTGKRYRITTIGPHGSKMTTRVKTYGDVPREYEYHPESKCADAEAHACGKQTEGLLHRRKVRVDGIRYIGKESNLQEDVEADMTHDAASVYTEYPDPYRDEWATKILPVIKAMPLSDLRRLTGMSRAALQAIRAGRGPHPSNRYALEAATFPKVEP